MSFNILRLHVKYISTQTRKVLKLPAGQNIFTLLQKDEEESIINETNAIRRQRGTKMSSSRPGKNHPGPPEHNGLRHCVQYFPLQVVVTLSLQLSGRRLPLTLWPVFIPPPQWRHRPAFDASSPPQTLRVRDRKCNSLGPPQSEIKQLNLFWVLSRCLQSGALVSKALSGLASSIKTHLDHT